MQKSGKMGEIREADKALFPIKNINAVVRLFKSQLENNDEPDLALLSIVTGFVENQLTARHNQSNGSSEASTLPVFELETVENLYNRFHTIITSAIESNTDKACATRELVKRVSDVIWNSLTRSYYKDRAHLQSLYSYLTDSKLDGFGVAFAVVAACQVLGYNDVHLALSEDHAWVVFGPNSNETAEVTWHGKGNEDKRGQEINKGIASRSWSYVNNRPVTCTRHIEVAALVSAINPSLSASADAIEVSSLQHELLWLLYDLGHLKKYPMAIGNLGDLEEIAPTRPEVKCEQLFIEAIESARKFYDNQHVYPYIYQGGFFYRHKRYKEAFESWANASDVIRLYNYSRDDEEIYKEFLEIANELIPNIMKLESSGFEAKTLLKRPECFANLLRFYDGICQWEEGSATPVLHIGWAKHLVNTITKYDADVRAQVRIVCDKKEGKPFPKESSLLFHNNNNYENTAKPVVITESKEAASLYPSIEALTAGCSEKILNPEYLLQRDGSPFVGLEQKEDPEEGKENGKPSTSKSPIPPEAKEEEAEEQPKDTRPLIVFHSQKMKELRDLMLAEKLNTQAISLHLTAQSQVQIGKKSRGDCDNTRPKRVALIMGVAGACRGVELCQLQNEDVQVQDFHLVVTVRNTKNQTDRCFIVKNSKESNATDVVKICKSYMALRPKNLTISRYFIGYKDGKCLSQPVGKNTFGLFPRKIAAFLNLPEAVSYTGHCFRRTSASLLADSGANIDQLKRHGGWKSATVAEGYVEQSIENKKKCGG